MTFNKFSYSLRPLVVFNRNDILKMNSRFNDVNLCNWQGRDYIVKLTKGYYTFGDIKIDKNLLCFAANKIVSPSYISCETALVYYGVASLEDSITSVCPVKSYKYISDYGGFKYHKINPLLMNNIRLVKYENQFIKIASLEKAIVDFFFFNPSYQSREQIKKLDFNKEALKVKINPEAITNITGDYKNNSLRRRVNNFLHVFYE